MTQVDDRFLDEKMDEVLARAAVGDEAPMRAIVVELWTARHGSDGGEASRAAAALGAAALDVTEDPSSLVRITTRLGRALADTALRAGVIDAAAAFGIVDAAAASAETAVAAYHKTARERREAWLSFLCHDLKNPLNTILNALWLIREHRASGNTDRFLELAERAVRKMEAGIKDIRELQSKDRTVPRGPGERIINAQPPAPR